ncbi:hypothetical protein DINM_006882 [Dirofilaria immitis]|nr:hypothetical protein [Dirofilaria immitis]
MTADKRSTTMKTTTTTNRRILFEYPALPKIELAFCYLVVACSMIYAWSQVLIASNNYKFQYWHQVRINRLPLIGDRYMDESNWEWKEWLPIGLMFIPFFTIHSIIFNIGGHYISDQSDGSWYSYDYTVMIRRIDSIVKRRIKNVRLMDSPDLFSCKRFFWVKIWNPVIM